jgi:hypothetical protein
MYIYPCDGTGGHMATSSFNKNFEVRKKKALNALIKASKAPPVKSALKRNILKDIEKGAKKLNLK